MLSRQGTGLPEGEGLSPQLPLLSQPDGGAHLQVAATRVSRCCRLLWPQRRGGPASCTSAHTRVAG